MNCLIFSVLAESGEIISGHIDPEKGKKEISSKQMAKLKDALEDEGFEVLELKLVEVQ